MKYLVVRNGTKFPNNFLLFLGLENTDVVDLENLVGVDHTKYDAIFLTGSNRYPIVYSEEKVSAEMELILNSTKPIIGMCYGCELINIAFGGTLEDKGSEGRMKGITHLQIVSDDYPFLEKYNGMEVYENHQWICDTVAEDFEVLAVSHSCAQIIKHKERQIWGIQFHPEKKTDQLDSDQLLNELIKHVTS